MIIAKVSSAIWVLSQRFSDFLRDFRRMKRRTPTERQLREERGGRGREREEVEGGRGRERGRSSRR